MMSDERFFSQVKATMADYSPEVPVAVYGGMRRKLWWSNFTRLSATRLNVWYLALALGAGMAGWAYISNKGSQANLPKHYEGQMNWSVPVAGNDAVAVAGAAQESIAVSNASTCSSAQKAGVCCSGKVKAGCNDAAEAQTSVASESNVSSTALEIQSVSSSVSNEEPRDGQETIQASETTAVAADAKPGQGRKKLKVPVFTKQAQNDAEKK